MLLKTPIGIFKRQGKVGKEMITVSSIERFNQEDKIYNLASLGKFLLGKIKIKIIEISFMKASTLLENYTNVI